MRGARRLRSPCYPVPQLSRKRRSGSAQGQAGDRCMRFAAFGHCGRVAPNEQSQAVECSRYRSQIQAGIPAPEGLQHKKHDPSAPPHCPAARGTSNSGADPIVAVTLGDEPKVSPAESKWPNAAPVRSCHLTSSSKVKVGRNGDERQDAANYGESWIHQYRIQGE
jgi:hypothetical protein